MHLTFNITLEYLLININGGIIVKVDILYFLNFLNMAFILQQDDFVPDIKEIQNTTGKKYTAYTINQHLQSQYIVKRKLIVNNISNISKTITSHLKQILYIIHHEKP
jgi:hypothetical protein